MNRKYEFTGETRKYCEHTLYRIRRISDGLIGGWIEKEENLSHEGNCFVYNDALVFGDARVSGNAQVLGNAEISGSAAVYGNAKVSERARIYGYARVSGNAEILESAWIYGYARVFGDAQVSECARVYGDARVFGYAQVSGYAWIFGAARVFAGSITQTEDIVYVAGICEHGITITNRKYVAIGRQYHTYAEFKRLYAEGHFEQIACTVQGLLAVLCDDE